MVSIEFDAAKDVANIAKHAVSLSLAEHVRWDTAVAWIDRRFEYGETRWIALVPLNETLYYVAFTWRFETRRIVSMRRAKLNEALRYATRP